MTAAGDTKDDTVEVSLNGTVARHLPGRSHGRTETFDETGTASVNVVLPASARREAGRCSR